jgi:hypothetical protein
MEFTIWLASWPNGGISRDLWDLAVFTAHAGEHGGSSVGIDPLGASGAACWASFDDFFLAMVEFAICIKIGHDVSAMGAGIHAINGNHFLTTFHRAKFAGFLANFIGIFVGGQTWVCTFAVIVGTGP